MKPGPGACSCSSPMHGKPSRSRPRLCRQQVPAGANTAVVTAGVMRRQNAKGPACRCTVPTSVRRPGPRRRFGTKAAVAICTLHRPQHHPRPCALRSNVGARSAFGVRRGCAAFGQRNLLPVFSCGGAMVQYNNSPTFSAATSAECHAAPQHVRCAPDQGRTHLVGWHGARFVAIFCS
jgi:hypothetical protein